MSFSKSVSDSDNKVFRLVLLGGGHTNIQVIKHIRKDNVSPHIELILVSDYKTSLYSGMCPGGVSTQYSESQFSVGLPGICTKLGWNFMEKKIIEIDGKNQILISDDNTQIKYDILCINIGSTNNGLKLPGVVQYAICTRPLKLLMSQILMKEQKLLKQIELQCRQRSQEYLQSTNVYAQNINNKLNVNVVVVGGGCAGCELSLGIQHRLLNSLQNILHNVANEDAMNVEFGLCLNVNIITNSDRLLKSDSSALSNAITNCMKQRCVNILLNSRVNEVNHNNGKRCEIKYDLLIWATGASSHCIKSDLSVDKFQWFQVNKYLQSISHSNIFAVGDCVNIIEFGDHSFPPKSGVYAVREGPILIHNLLQCLKQYKSIADETESEIKMDSVNNNVSGFDSNEKQSWKAYEPQTDFLRLLNTGDGKAIGSKFGIAFYGAWVWKLKDWIDVSWMKKFNIHQMKAEESQHFKPVMVDSKCIQMTVENAVKYLLLNDEPNEFESFAFQWKTLQKMNDDSIFMEKVVQAVKKCTFYHFDILS